MQERERERERERRDETRKNASESEKPRAESKIRRIGIRRSLAALDCTRRNEIRRFNKVSVGKLQSASRHVAIVAAIARDV